MHEYDDQEYNGRLMNPQFSPSAPAPTPIGDFKKGSNRFIAKNLSNPRTIIDDRTDGYNIRTYRKTDDGTRPLLSCVVAHTLYR